MCDPPCVRVALNRSGVFALPVSMRWLQLADLSET